MIQDKTAEKPKARFHRKMGSDGAREFGDFILNILTTNTSTSRKEWLLQSGDSRRSIEDACGYDDREWTAEEYYHSYSNSPIAGRVVEMMAEACWQVNPEIYEVEDVETETPFEAAVKDLCRNIRVGKNRYLSQVGNPLWELLKRADKLSGIGRYGCILIGLNDGKKLSEPAEINPEAYGESGPITTNAQPSNPLTSSTTGTNTVTTPSGRKVKVTYLRAFPEHLAKVSRLETNEYSPRYNQPIEYELILHDPRSDPLDDRSTTGKSILVHWTRIVHVVDNLESNEVYGVPRQRHVRRPIQDLTKLYGGSAEMYWRGAFPGLSFETHPTLGGDADMDLESLKDTAEKYLNGLDRYLATVGISVKSLAPQVVDPSPQIERQIELICIKMDVPKRKFIGAESGEMASTQDEDRWKEKVRSRQNMQVTPNLIAVLFNRLIDLYVLPEVESFRVWWPDIQTQSSLEKARVAVSRTQALVQYIAGQVQLIMTVKDYFVNVLGYTEAEALTIFENVKNRPEEELMTLEQINPLEAKQAELDAEAAKMKVQSQDSNTPNTVRSQGEGRSNQSADAEGKR